MTPWFTNSWLRLGGSKKRAQQYKDENDKENEGSSYPSYPKNKKAKKTEAPVKATPSEAGSWFLCQDREGRMYWWNDVTGQWTYQLYSPQPEQHPQQQQQMMLPSMHQHHHGLSYSHQQQPHQVYNPTSYYGHQYSPSVMVPSSTSPHMYMRQQPPWGLVSPSTAASSQGSGIAGRGALPAASAIGGFGLGWGIASSSDDGEEEEEEEEKAVEGGEEEEEDDDDDDEEEEEEETGTWDKFFDASGIPVWIHSETGARTMMNPAMTA